MSIAFLLPMAALAVAPPEAAPAVVAPPAAAGQTTPATTSPAASDAPELSDPLADPAAEPAPAAVVAKPRRHPKDDPLEGFNRFMFGIHMKLDKAIYRPLAMAHKTVIPKPARSGLRNFFTNLSEPLAFLNFLLQLKIGKAAETFARFGINSTLGIAGLFDIAKRDDFKLPHRENGFGNTLARYGVGPGPYIFLPFLGPSTLRDLAAEPADGAVLPVAIGKPFSRAEYQLATGILEGLDRRAEADPELKALFSGAVDPYATLRSAWLQNRAAQVAEIRAHRHKKKKKGDAEAAQQADPLADPLTDPATGLQGETPREPQDAPAVSATPVSPAPPEPAPTPRF